MTSAALKLFALFCMTIDHIGAFILVDTTWLRWVGRLSAPIFLFVFVHSLDLTQNRKNLLKRLYCFNVIMCCVLLLWKSLFKIIIVNNIFATLFSIVAFIYVLECISQKKRYWKLLLVLYIIIQIALSVLILFLHIFDLGTLAIVISSLTANIFANEGRLFFVVLGVALYHYKGNKIKYSIAYIILYLFHSSIIMFEISPKIHSFVENTKISLLYEGFSLILGYNFDEPFAVSPFLNHFEWMGILALPFMWLYNGQEGSKNKYQFYVYYPFHIALLSIIGKVIIN